jgi:class 3 adenylate cyclase
VIALLAATLLLAACVAIYAFVLFKRYVLERGERARIQALFSRYVPPQVVEELLERKDPRLFDAREYYATMLCVRIRNFSLFSETLSPEETLRYLNEFYTIVGQAVERHHGMIEGLRGESVHAVFGVLVDEKFQEERALRAALDVMRMMNAMEPRWAAAGRKAFTVGMGVNSGKIVAGDTGYNARREFAVIGHPARVAVELEAASEELNAAIVASDVTYDAVRELFAGVPCSSLPLRGLRRLQNAYIIRGLTRRASEDDLLTLPSERAFKETAVRRPEPPAAPAVEPDAYVAPSQPHTPPTRFALLDDSPALPEIPPIAGTYEDDQGPPVQLPPP